jgi:hypothetical protein
MEPPTEAALLLQGLRQNDRKRNGRDRSPLHPQAKSNPQESWCYPLAALGAYRTWLQDIYIEGGKFSTYLKGKVSKGEIAPSIAQLAVAALVPTQIAPPR